jgi:glutamate-5-semialdehyde dehydrogenase
MADARAAGLPTPKLRRLELTDAGITQMIRGLEQVIALADPVGQVTRDTQMPRGLRVQRVRAPLGVIAMIYEARPTVTIDAFALCFKAGNACILKGGREAHHSNSALAEIVRAALEEHALPAELLTLVDTSDRDALRRLLQQNSFIDLVIPRGGHDLVRFVAENSRIPTIQHYQGVCHIFVDESAKQDQAFEICVTAKTSAPATCNAVECVLVHRGIADRFVPLLVDRYAAAGVEVRGGPIVCALSPTARRAAPDDFGREFLDLIVAMRVVPDLETAIQHVMTYGSNHTEAILTQSEENAARFTAQVQASCTLINASTRFNDGFQLGLGAEIGISTSKLHAYGPMGLEDLTIQRYVVHGSGQTR